MQEFKIDKKLITLMKGCLVFFLAFIVFGFLLPFFPDNEAETSGTAIRTTILCTVVFGVFSILTWLTIRKLPYVDVVIDDDGIWYKHLGKEQGLIPWKKISKVKERDLLQCLYLLDSNGIKLLRVEYQLIDFEILRYHLFEKINTKPSELECSRFTKGYHYHMFNLFGVIAFTALGLYLGTNGNHLLGYGGMSFLVVITIYDYAITAYGIEINNGAIKIYYPIGNKNILISDIAGVHIVDEFERGSRTPEVWVISRQSKKPFKLKKLGVDSNLLFAVIRKAVQLP
ncbi:hypothetical protein [Photobacterium profundum]|uniref:Uncharacterized protein n=1 Tax=Photobacterium profundum 3TCK TaxID=314280 RepID=Q1YYG9_9GAMM|nr:hypothetical protein [Photobacterium profundum]EAS41353.1 hypothetical protein P3TCK_07514 [Photobacterium profundum 3TCK]